MPIYEYQCDACGKRQEIMRRLADKPLKKCPLCGERKLRKLVSAAAFRLKGGGWYETDFKKDEKSRRNLTKADEGGAEKVEAKSEAKANKAEKSETKTETADKKTETAKENTPRVEAKPKEKKKAKRADD